MTGDEDDLNQWLLGLGLCKKRGDGTPPPSNKVLNILDVKPIRSDGESSQKITTKKPTFNKIVKQSRIPANQYGA